jgi:site-specific recombinase XerD
MLKIRGAFCMDFMETYEMFLEYATAKGRSELTIASYRQDARTFLNFLAEKRMGKNVEDIDLRTIRLYTVWLRAKKFSLASINHKLDSMGSFFKFLENEDMIQKNIMKRVERPKIPKRLPVFLTEDERNRLLYVVEHSKNKHRLRDVALIKISLYLGLRRSEVIALNWQDIDFKTSTLKIIQGKGKKDRVLPMNSELRESLWEYLQSRLPLSHPALFTNRYHNRIKQNNISRILNNYTRQAGIDKHVTTHLLRHTCATNLAERTDLITVKELLGHDSLETTQIYSHTTLQRMAEAVEKLEKPKAKVKTNSNQKGFRIKILRHPLQL